MVGASHQREIMADRLHVAADETTADGQLTFVPMAVCIGGFDLGPLVEIEGHRLAEPDDAHHHAWLTTPLDASRPRMATMPGPSFVPLFLALLIPVLCIGLLARHFFIVAVGTIGMGWGRPRWHPDVGS